MSGVLPSNAGDSGDRFGADVDERGRVELSKKRAELKVLKARLEVRLLFNF